MLSGVAQADGLVDRLLAAGGSGDAAILAGVAVVVGIMLWAAGARAVSLAFAAAGATAAAAAAGMAILATPHLPAHLATPSHQPVVVQPAAFEQPQHESTQTVDPWTDTHEAAPQAQAQPAYGREIIDQATAAWQRVPEGFQGHAALAVLGAGLLGAMLGAIWPARVASATTAFMGAAIWPLGAIHMQAAAGTPLPIEETPARAWLLAWLVLGIVGLGIQRLVVRKVAES